ncbi:VanZ family protein [Brevibacillus sp. SAFN-007a]|uniref:VanZ family protein n=1 Tax=Brevibacillus sp. SAFN-007a TaxID=3436862 RepID=UPI003F7DE66E
MHLVLIRLHCFQWIIRIHFAGFTVFFEGLLKKSNNGSKKTPFIPIVETERYPLLLFNRYPLFIGLIFILMSVLMLRYKWRKGYPFLFFYTLFSFYLLQVLKFTIFPIPIDPRLIAVRASRVNAFSEEIHLLPLHFPPGFEMDMQVLLNILLTVPFGFGVAFLIKTTLKKMAVLGLSVGFTIELLQLAIGLSLGFPYRYIDVNDVIFNFIGVMIGYMLFTIFSVIFIKVTKNSPIRNDPFLKYVFDICVSSGEKHPGKYEEN